MNGFENSSGERTFVQKYGFLLGVVGLIGVATAIILLAPKADDKPKTMVPPEIAIVNVPTLPPPPPTPPPTPPPEPEVQEELEQSPVMDDVPPPDNAPAAPASADMGTNNSATGNDSFGLGRSTGSRIGQVGPRRSTGGKWGWYAAAVQRNVGDVLRTHPKTKTAAMRVEIRIWPDSTGRINRAKLVASTGDAVLDSALENEVLTGIQLEKPPPADMPLPIRIRLTARRPN